MTLKKNYYKLLSLFIAALFLAGCSLGLSRTSSTDGGVYVSVDKGDNWEQKVFVSKGEKSDVTIGNLNIDRLVLWPTDKQVLYALSGQSGVWATFNSGAEWKKIFQQSPRSLILHPTNRDILLVASGNKIFRTVDGGASWQTVYIEGAPETAVNDILMDVADSETIYAITSKGSLLKSRDGGVSWQSIFRFTTEVSRLYMGAGGTMFVGMPSRGLWRSSDRGVTWIDLQIKLDELNLGRKAGTFRQFAFIPGTADGFLYVNSYGIFKSSDGGANWELINLVTPPSSVGINTLAINPVNTNEIFYAISRLLYYSSDGGITWITKAIPSSRVATAMAVSSNENLELFLGLTRPSK